MPALVRIALVACLASLCGCATYADRVREIRADFYAGNLDAANRAIDEELARNGNDTDVLKLERSIVQLFAGKPQAAEQTLRDVRDRFDHLEQKSAAEGALAMLTDDNAMAYAGEDHEKVLVRVMLALSNLMGDGGDAAAYSLQIADKQQQIIHAGGESAEQNPKLAYNQVAVGPYLHGMLREATHANFDDSARAYAQVVSWEPSFPSARLDLQRAQGGRHSQPGNGVLYVFTLVGRGPYKAEVEEIPSTVALLVADRILSAAGKQSLPPTIAPIKVPKVMTQPGAVDQVLVSINGQQAGATATITDVSRIANDQCRSTRDAVLGRAVARRAVKKAIVYGAKETLGVQKHSVESLLFDVGGVVWEATETADTRCWGLLPDKIQVLRLELPAGEHTIGLLPQGRFGIGTTENVRVSISNGRNSYVLANFPSGRMVGQALVKAQ